MSNSAARLEAKLTGEGFAIRTQHRRIYYVDTPDLLLPPRPKGAKSGKWLTITERLLDPCGGETEVRIMRPSDGNLLEVVMGASVCRPDEHFNKKMGREIALERAVVTLILLSHFPKLEAALRATGLDENGRAAWSHLYLKGEFDTRIMEFVQGQAHNERMAEKGDPFERFAQALRRGEIVMPFHRSGFPWNG